MSDYPELESPTPEPTPTPPAPVGMTPAPTPVIRSPWWQEWLIPILMLAGLALVVVVAALIIPRLRPQTHSGESTAFFPKQLTFSSPLAPQAYTPVLVVEGTARVPALPQTLELGGAQFSVVPVKPEFGHWPVPGNPAQAAWVYGTLVNYVLGIPYSEENAALLQGLAPTAVVTLTLENGIALTFGSPQVALQVPEAGLFEQRQPGLTLVLLGGPEGGEARWVLRTAYLPSVSVAMGQTQAIGDTFITATRVELVERKPERFLVVDYQLSVNGVVALDPTQMALVLEDGNGTRYQPDPTVLLDGHATPLTAPVAPGTTVMGSASYRLTEAPVLPLAWLVRIGERQTRIALGYVPATPAPAQANVSIQRAWYEPERNELHITGTIRNLGAQALAVNGTQIRLTSVQGEATLRGFSPLLPWSLAGGEQESFEAIFDRPADVNEVTFEALGFVFRLGGLP